MGAPIVRRLHEQGYSITVCDRNEQVLGYWGELGLTVARRPMECASVDVVLVLVATSQQVRDVLLGDTGVVAGLTGLKAPLVLLMSTTTESVVRDVGTQLMDHGVTICDAPISGGVVRAESGTLSVMLGGAAADVNRVRPLLEVIARDVFYCGPLGTGATMKIVNNIIGTGSAMLAAEACRIAHERGLVMDDVVTVLEASSGRMWLTAEPGELTEFFRRVTQRREDFDSLVSVMRKDFGLAVELSHEVDGTYPLVASMKMFADTMGEESYDNWRSLGGPVAGAVSGPDVGEAIA